MFTTILRILLFSLSMLGYIFYIYRKTKIQIEFLPIITISMITLGLFFGSLMNGLVFSTVLLFLLGIILFIKENIYYLRKSIWKDQIQQYLTPGVIFITLLAIYFVFLFKEQRLIHYDNFSHWGIIVKHLLISNALPTIEDTIISFNSYPPGSALFIYYFSKIVGQTEGLALLGQMTIILSSLLTIFSFSSFKISEIFTTANHYSKKLLLNILTIFLVIYLLDGPSSVHDLLVDNLLTILGIALFSLVYYYLDSPRKIAIPLIFIAAFITLIKNSGMFFAILALALYGFNVIRQVRRDKGKGQYSIKDRVYLFLPFVAPYAINKLWTNHVAATFPIDQLGKHTVGLENYLATFNEKSTLEIQTITVNFLDTLWNEHALQILLLLLLFIVFFSIFYYLFNKQTHKKIITLSVVVLMIFVFYSLGLWVMYLVSMPLGEALYLAGYPRYMDTIVNYLFGISVIAIIHTLTEIESKLFFNGSAFTLGMALLYLTVIGQNFQETQIIFTRQKINIDSYQQAVSHIEKSLVHLDPNPMLSNAGSDDYYIYTPNIDTIGYASYYIDYRLYQKNVRHVNQINSPDELWDYNFLVASEVTEEIKNIFSTYSTVSPTVGTYELDGADNQIGNKLQSYN